MIEWTENEPTTRGWFIWYREEYDILRKELVIAEWSAGDQTHDPENLRAYPGKRPFSSFVGGVWYGPIPFPPVSF